MTTPRYPVRACVAGSQVRGETASSPASSAFNVNLNNGNVNNNHRNNSGFGLACRRAREFQGAGRVELRALFDAYQSARRGKRPSYDKLGFERRLIDELFQLQAELAAGTWSPAPSTCFVATRPKAREIHAPAFRDRVVHHWLVPQLEAIYEPRFIAHSYANRSGKGSHAAVRYAQACTRQVHAGQGGGFYLQLDIRNFFNSIRRDLLWARMKPTLERAGLPMEAMRATHALLRGDPLRAGVRMRASAKQLDLVPRHKRLAHAPRHCGLPIGNLSSQFLANVCMDALDQFVKHELKAKRYVRYVDDFVLFHSDRAQLADWQCRIEHFLADALGLRLKDEIKLRPLTAGLDFLGYVIYPSHMRARRRVVAHLQQALSNWEAAHVRGDQLLGTPADFDHIRTVLASYAGHLRHAATRRLWMRIERRYPWIATAAMPRRFSYRLQGRHISLRSRTMPETHNSAKGGGNPPAKVAVPISCRRSGIPLMRWLTEPMWRLVALIVARPRIADWLIQRAQRTPYFHIDGYMQRWWLFNPYPSDRSMSDADRGHAKRLSWLPSIRIHHILREDRAAHHHDHPWNARTIILRGFYDEARIEPGRYGDDDIAALYRREPGNTAQIMFGEFHHIHRVSPGGVWTLFITWSYGGSWGFNVGGVKVPHREYAKRYPERMT